MNRKSRRDFLKAVGTLPPLAIMGGGAVGLAGLTTPANATGPFYRLVQTEIPNSAPLLPQFPTAGCRTAGVNVAKWTAAGNNNATASSSDQQFPASRLNNGDNFSQWWKSGVQNAPPGTDWAMVGIPSSIGPAVWLKEVIVYSVQDNSTNPVAPTDTMTFDPTKYGCVNFRLQGYNVNGQTGQWTDLAVIRNNTMVKKRIPLVNVNCGAVRVLFDMPCTNFGGFNRVCEIEMYTRDSDVYPFRYPDAATANADVTRFTAWKAWLVDGFTTAMMQREPQYAFSVVEESALAVNVNKVEYTPANTVGVTVTDPLVYDNQGGTLIKNLTIDQIALVLGVAGFGILAGIILGIPASIAAAFYVGTVAGLFLLMAGAIGVWSYLTDENPVIMENPLYYWMELRFPPGNRNGRQNNANYLMNHAAVNFKRGLVASRT